MLRLSVVLLALANGVFYAWHEGWLPGLSAAVPEASSSGHRLTDQVHPERLLVITASGAVASPALTAAPSARPGNSASGAPSASEMASSTVAVAASLATAASAAPLPASEANLGEGAKGAPVALTPSTTQCLEAGPFTADENRQALLQMGKVLPKGTWSTQAVSVPGLWLVYMGPYPDAEALQRKLVELRRLRSLSFEEVRSPSNLALGVSLGRFADERQANASLETMRLRGVRTARVVNARPAMELMVLRVAQASPLDQGKLNALPLPAGKGFIACAN